MHGVTVPCTLASFLAMSAMQGNLSIFTGGWDEVAVTSLVVEQSVQVKQLETLVVGTVLLVGLLQDELVG